MGALHPGPGFDVAEKLVGLQASGGGVLHGVEHEENAG